MTNKERYTEWVKPQERLPIFMQPWWLDAVCAGKEWDVLLIKSPILFQEAAKDFSLENNIPPQCPTSEDKTQTTPSVPQEEIIAVMPYLFRKKWWMRWVLMPQETQIGGIWLNEKIHFEPEEINSICSRFAEQLKALKLHYYYQHFPIGSPCPAFMKELGFKVKERVTYRITELDDLDKVLERFSKNKKRQLHKSLSLHAETSMTAEEFYTFHKACIDKKNKELSYSREFFLVLEQKLRKRHQSQILTICNADHVPYAAAFLVWDKQQMYYLIPCYDPDYRESGAGALLVLEALKIARQQGVGFDFEGSMIAGVARHYKQFGSVPFTYYSVARYYHPLFGLAMAFNWLRGRRYR